jgi:Family of unknown function (DUF6114)
METITTIFDEVAPATADIDPTPTRTGVAAGWHAVRRYRRTRPFWGSLILAFGGWFVLKPVVGSAAMTMELGVGGVSGYLLGGGMIAAALVAFVLPAQRHFPALMAAMMSVASLPLANLGGWLIGMILDIVGSCLVFAWTPYSDKQLAKFAERDRRRAEKKALRKERA